MALGNILALTRPKSGSPYSIGSVAPSLLNSVMTEQTKSDLVRESSSYLPDAETLSQAIMDKDIFAGNKQQYMQGLNSLTRDFMSKYKKDPYYAFTNEAKRSIQRMQDIANDPRLDAMVQAKATSDSELERARKDDMDFNPVIQDGRAFVNRDGKPQWIPLSQLEEGDVPMNFTQQYDMAMGMGTPAQAIQYDMSDWKTVLDKVTTAAANLGSEAYDARIGGGLMARTKSQVDAAQERLKWLNENGFTKADINAIQSEYIKKTGDVSPNTHMNALQWAAGLGESYLKGTIDTSQSIAVDPGVTAAKQRAETLKLDASIGPLERMFAVGKGDPQSYMKQEGESEASLHMGAPIDNGFWNTGKKIAKSFYDEGDLPFSSNERLQEIMEDPSQQFTTPDGVPLDGNSLIRDNTHEIRYVFENGKTYAYVPALYVTDEYTNDAFENSTFVGKRDPKTGAFTKESVGDAGDTSNHHEQRVTGIRNAIEENDDTMPQHLLGVDDSDLIDDNIYQTLVKVAVRSDVETRMRELDKQPHHSSKQFHTLIPGGAGEDTNMIQLQ